MTIQLTFQNCLYCMKSPYSLLFRICTSESLGSTTPSGVGIPMSKLPRYTPRARPNTANDFLQQPSTSAASGQKSPVFYQKSPVFYQKSNRSSEPYILSTEP